MKFDMNDFIELDVKALFAVNGGSSCGGAAQNKKNAEPSASSPSSPKNPSVSYGGTSAVKVSGSCSSASTPPNEKKPKKDISYSNHTSASGSCGGVSHGNEESSPHSSYESSQNKSNEENSSSQSLPNMSFEDYSDSGKVKTSYSRTENGVEGSVSISIKNDFDIIGGVNLTYAKSEERGDFGISVKGNHNGSLMDISVMTNEGTVSGAIDSISIGGRKWF